MMRMIQVMRLYFNVSYQLILVTGFNKLIRGSSLSNLNIIRLTLLQCRRTCRGDVGIYFLR